jgi:hypothetical protein
LKFKGRETRKKREELERRKEDKNIHDSVVQKDGSR